MDNAASATEEVKFPTDEKIKMSKVEKFFSSQKEKFNLHMKGFEASLGKKQDGYQSSLDAFIKSANEKLDKTDKKFSGMFNYLTRQFLTSMEERIYTIELANKTLLMMYADKMYELEAAKGGAIPTKEDFIKAIEADYVSRITEIHTQTQAAAAEKQEVKNEEHDTTLAEEPVQSVPAEASTEEVPAQ